MVEVHFMRHSVRFSGHSQEIADNYFSRGITEPKEDGSLIEFTIFQEKSKKAYERSGCLISLTCFSLKQYCSGEIYNCTQSRKKGGNMEYVHSSKTRRLPIAV